MSPVIVKRLATSEIKWFKSVEHKLGADGGSQKGISPTSLLQVIYPDLGDDWGNRIDVAVTGPGLTQTIIFPQRMLNKSNGRNWRIQTDADDVPYGSPYRNLEENDFAVICFSGERYPTGAHVFLVSSNVPEDIEIYAVLEQLRQELSTGITRYSAYVINPEDMLHRIPVDNLVATHPLLMRLVVAEADAAVERAPYNPAVHALNHLRQTFRRLEAEQFAERRRKAEDTGRWGEAIVHAYLQSLKSAGRVVEVQWVSMQYPGNPFDFLVQFPGGEVRRIEVKSTSLPFAESFHISEAEMRVAAHDPVPYDIMFVSGVGSENPVIRFTSNAGLVLGNIAAQVQVPPGVRLDGYVISCGYFEVQPVEPL